MGSATVAGDRREVRVECCSFRLRCYCRPILEKKILAWTHTCVRSAWLPKRRSLCSLSSFGPCIWAMTQAGSTSGIRKCDNQAKASIRSSLIYKYIRLSVFRYSLKFCYLKFAAGRKSEKESDKKWTRTPTKLVLAL